MMSQGVSQQTNQSSSALKGQVLSELKTLFKYCFYSIVEIFENQERVKQFEKDTKKKATLDILLSLKKNDEFWTTTTPLLNKWMRAEFPPSMLMELLPVVLQGEYPSIKENSLVVEVLELLLTHYVQELYDTNNATNIIQHISNEESLSGRALYLSQVASCLITRVFMDKAHSKQVNFDEIFRQIQSQYYYYPELSITVKKQPFLYFSNPPMYEFCILGTDKMFKSFEKDVRKATLLYHRLTC